MRKTNAVRLGLTFAGCFLGAGYVSGQELWQFFGSFGKNGIFGLATAMLLLFIIGIIMILLNRATGIREVDKLVVRKDIKVLRYAVAVLELLFLFGVCVIMAAGVGALLEQLFGVPLWIGAAVFTLVVALVSMKGLGGMVSAFSATVPVLAGVTLIFGIMSVVQHGFALPAVSDSGSNPLMSSWLVAAVSFACYNVFGSIAMVSPLGTSVKSGKSGILGIAIGSLILLMIAGSVLVSVSAYPGVTEAELPMLALASGMSGVLGLVYGFLLLLAMFGTALSSMVAFTGFLSLKSEKINSRKGLFTAACAVAMFLGSLFGFGDLISVIYPLFGYCSSVFIVLMAVHYIKVRRVKV